MSTADILACGIVAQSLTWPAATVILARHFSRQVRLAAPPKDPPTAEPDEGMLARLKAAFAEEPGVSRVAAIGHGVVRQQQGGEPCT